MKKYSRKIAKVALTIIAGGAFVMMTATAKNEKSQILLSGGSAIVLALSAKALEKMGVFDQGGRNDVEI